MGDPEGALAMLERSMQESKGSIGNAEFDPDLEILRDDPRFKALLAKAKERLAKFRK
jgi:hypothetical protein